MKKMVIFSLIIVLFLSSILVFVREVKSFDASGTIFIRADGSVDPSTVPIQRNGDMYTLTENITFPDADGIVVERDNVILNGTNCTIYGVINPIDYNRGIYLGNRSNVTIENIRVASFSYGIILDSCTDCALVDSYVIETRAEPLVIVGSNNTVNGNTMGGSFSDATSLRLHGLYNNIVGNNMASLSLNYPHLRTTTHNNITENEIGEIYFESASNNSIYHNRLGAVYPESSTDGNAWDDGYSSGGNLWGNYSGFDFYGGVYQNETGSDGIGDTPYVVNVNNIDHYPWMMMRTSSPVRPVAVIETRLAEMVKVGDAVFFNASHSISGWNGTYVSPIKEYIWAFGDGNTTSENERTVEHAYRSSEHFVVSLTVVDTDNRNSSVVTTIDVFMPTLISISTTSPSSLIGFAVGINGTLQDSYGLGLSNKTILLSYTFRGASSWFPITSSVTDDFGRYSAQWIPTATGYFTIRAEWSGNDTQLGTNDTVTLCTVPYENQYIFTVESNSTISALAFNNTSYTLDFTVYGINGTKGYTKVTIAKSLVPDVTKLTVRIDGMEHNYTLAESDDSLVLILTYSHSNHQMEIDLGQPAIPEFPFFLILPLFMLATLLAVIIYKRKRG